MSNKITVNLGKNSYDILIGAGQINFLERFLQEKSYSKIFVITDENVAKLHKNALKNAVKDQNLHFLTLNSGEQTKDFSILQNVCEEILTYNIDRKSLIIAFGGGVIGDLSGFVASILLRGIDFIQIPTTLLACVDSSVGGKTAINSKSGKNLIGSFYQPKLVICDLNFLETLPEREFRAGYAEILKYGLIDDKEFFEFLDQNLAKIFAKDAEILQKIIAKSCFCKAKIVSMDEKENSVRALLNFGHTFAHVFEIETNYSNELLHGEAVGVGMLLAAKMSVNLNMLSESEYEKIKTHIAKTQLDFVLQKIKNFDINNLVLHLYKDKKNENNNLTFILLEKLGKAVIKKSVDILEFKKVLQQF